MKSKTIVRHILELEDNEVRLIYHALRNFEKKDYLKLDMVGINTDKVEELKRSFYELIKPHSEYYKRKQNE